MKLFVVHNRSDQAVSVERHHDGTGWRAAADVPPRDVAVVCGYLPGRLFRAVRRDTGATLGMWHAAGSAAEAGERDVAPGDLLVVTPAGKLSRRPAAQTSPYRRAFPKRVSAADLLHNAGFWVVVAGVVLFCVALAMRKT